MLAFLSPLLISSRSLHQGIIIEPTKTNNSRRSVDLDDNTIAVLRAHIGLPLNPMALTNAFQSYARRIGLLEAKLPDLMHFHASLFQKGGGSL